MNCSNLFEATQEIGGALGVLGGAKCYCTDCDIIDNRAGGICVGGLMWLKGSEFLENTGIFGGIYVNGEVAALILSLTFCEFEGNGGLLEGCCVRILFFCPSSIRTMGRELIQW
jgi:hypothetical protein